MPVAQPLSIGAVAPACWASAKGANPFDQPELQTQSGVTWERKCSEWDEGWSAGNAERKEKVIHCAVKPRPKGRGGCQLINQWSQSDKSTKISSNKSAMFEL